MKIPTIYEYQVFFGKFYDYQVNSWRLSKKKIKNKV